MDDPSVVDSLIAAADPVAWPDAEEGDLIASFLGHVVAGRYANSGEFLVTISIPAEILDPHAMMKSIGNMTYWESRKA
jgi:hypothetical protein